MLSCCTVHTVTPSCKNVLILFCASWLKSNHPKCSPVVFHFVLFDKDGLCMHINHSLKGDSDWFALCKLRRRPVECWRQKKKKKGGKWVWFCHAEKPPPDPCNPSLKGFVLIQVEGPPKVAGREATSRSVNIVLHPPHLNQKHNFLPLFLFALLAHGKLKCVISSPLMAPNRTVKIMTNFRQLCLSAIAQINTCPKLMPLAESSTYSVIIKVFALLRHDAILNVNLLKY